jgi:hypothetical protein
VDRIITKTEEIFLDPSGIIKCKVLKGVYMKLPDAIENIEAVKKISNGKQVAVLVDIRNSKGANKECRDYYAGEEAASAQKACALLIGSPLTVIIGSFFLGLNKTKFPTKLFWKEEAAMEWLSEFL